MRLVGKISTMAQTVSPGHLVTQQMCRMGEDFRRPDLWLWQLEHDAGSSTRKVGSQEVGTV